MSARRWPFPTLSDVDTVQARIAADCARRGIALAWGTPPAQGAMLRFDVRGPFGTLQLAVAAADWCPQMLPALSGLAWSELVDRDTLTCWLPDAPLLQLNQPALSDAQVSLHDVVPADVRVAACPRRAYIATAQGAAWIEHAALAPQLHPTDAAGALALPVDLEVARISLPLQRVRTLAPGSVLLLTQFLPVARHGAQRLYSFDFTLETVSVNTPFDFTEDDAIGFDPIPAAPAPTPAGLDLARLPVTVEVVLCQLQQRVGDLAVLQPGTVFNLPPDAWTQLQLRVNGQTIARGELVQVGEQLGVQLHQAPVLP